MTTCPTGSGFDPSSMVEAFHSIPHTDIDLQDSPDQFEPSNGHYWEVGTVLQYTYSCCAPAMHATVRV